MADGRSAQKRILPNRPHRGNMVQILSYRRGKKRNELGGKSWQIEKQPCRLVHPNGSKESETPVHNRANDRSNSAMTERT